MVFSVVINKGLSLLNIHNFMMNDVSMSFNAVRKVCLLLTFIL